MFFDCAFRCKKLLYVLFNDCSCSYCDLQRGSTVISKTKNALDIRISY